METTQKLTPEQKKILAKAGFDANDIGGKTKAKAIVHASGGKLNEINNDPLTQYIQDTIRDEEDQDGIITTLDYAINQLTRARNAIAKVEL